MVYTRKQRGVKKTSKYGGRRNYRKGSLKTGGKRTMKNVGGGILSKCCRCLPPGFSDKNKFLSSDTHEQIEAKLNRMFDDETPSNILRYMLSNWANFSTTETPNITLEQKAALFNKVSGAAADKIARDSRKQSEALSRAIAGVPARSRSRSSPSSSSKSSSRSSSDSPKSDSAASLDAELARLEAEVNAEKEGSTANA